MELGQIRWSKKWCDSPIHHHRNNAEKRRCGGRPIVAVYAPGQQFIAQLDNVEDIALFNARIMDALRLVSAQQTARKTFVSDSEPEEVLGAAV